MSRGSTGIGEVVVVAWTVFVLVLIGLFVGVFVIAAAVMLAPFVILFLVFL